MPEAPETFHPHLSADGAWRWDGRVWVPVTDAQSQAKPEPAQEGKEASEGEGEGNEGAEAARRYGWPMVGAMIGVALVAIAVLIGAALLAYRAAGSPPPNVVVTPTPQVVNPNSLNYRYLQGVTVGSLTAALQGGGFTCAPPTPPENNLRSWRCDRTRATTQRDIVQIWAVDPSHVHLVEATTVAEAGPLDTTGAAAAAQQVARLIYPSSAANATAAAAWVAAHPTAGATTSIGGVTLRTDRSTVATLVEFNAGARH